MRFFIHLAVGRFGAEVLGRLQEWVSDRGPEVRRRHSFVWAGPGELPGHESYWDPRFPDWDERLPLAWGESPDPQQARRGELATRISGALASEEGWSGLRRLVVDVPQDRFGESVVVEPHLAIVSSFADPLGSAGILGLLDGLDSLRSTGRLDLPADCFLGVGAAGSILNEPTTARRVAAQSLEDFERLLTQRMGEGGRPVGCFLVGEAGPDGHDLDCRSQVTVCSMAVDAWYRSRDAAAPADGSLINPFLIRWDADGSATQGRQDRPFRADAPFSVVGGYRVGIRRSRTTRTLAASLCRRTFETLGAAQPGAMSLDDASELDEASGPSVTWALLHECERRVYRRIVDALGARPRRFPDDGHPPSPEESWTDFTYFEHLATSVYSTRTWEDLFETFGEFRITRLPLRDWDNGMTDLVEVMEAVLIPKRDLYFRELEGETVTELLLALDAEADRIAGMTFGEEVGARPHRRITVLLGRILAHLEKAALRVRRDKLDHNPRRRDDEVSHVERLSDQVRAAVEAIPNPFAVFTRFLPYFLLIVFGVYLVPVGLGIWDPEGRRILLGLGLGGLFLAVMWWRTMEVARERAQSRLKVWLEAVKLSAIRDDERRRLEALGELLSRMEDAVRWFGAGDGPPPLPSDSLPIMKTPRADRLDVLAEEEDRYTPQSALRDVQDHVRVAGDSFQTAEEVLLRGFQPSRMEAILPELSPSRRNELDELLRRALAGSRSDDPPTLVQRVVRDLGRRLRESENPDALTEGLVPFSSRGDAEAGPPWRRCFHLPDGESLLDPEARRSSSGFRFFETVNRELGRRIADRVSLSVEVGELADERVDALQARFTNWSVPTIWTGEEKAPRFLVVASGPTDPFANLYQDAEDVPRLDGEDRCSVVLQVRLGLSAREVIFYPNEERPTQPLGLARKSQDSVKDVAPCVLPAELRAGA